MSGNPPHRKVIEDNSLSVPSNQTSGANLFFGIRQGQVKFMTDNFYKSVRDANRCLHPNASRSENLRRLYAHLAHTDTTGLDHITATDFRYAIKALLCASNDDLSGVASQYQRLVSTNKESPDSERVFFTLWHRTKNKEAEPFFAVCRINRRNLDLLRVTRSVAFVDEVAARLGASSYPEAILSSRMQGVEVQASAGACPQVLFADFVEMGMSEIDPATAGGLLFDAFGDDFLKNQLKQVKRAFPNVAEWLEAKAVLNPESIHLLTTAHVQGHDLCGHCVPYNLNDPTRLASNQFLRQPLEECYADTQAMWIFSSPVTRPFLRQVLTEDEIETVSVLIAMKRLAFYATLDAEDHDARCAWMLFCYWRKAGLIRNDRSACGAFTFDIEHFPAAVDQLLSDLLQIEYAIGGGVQEYEQACRTFSQRYGYENPVTKHWNMPDDLRFALGHYGESPAEATRL